MRKWTAHLAILAVAAFYALPALADGPPTCIWPGVHFPQGCVWGAAPSSPAPVASPVAARRPETTASLKTADLSYLATVMIHPSYANVVADLMASENPAHPFQYMVSSIVVTRDPQKYTAQVVIGILKAAKYGSAESGRIIANLDIVMDAPPIVTDVSFVPAPPSI